MKTKRYRREVAMHVADELCNALRPVCVRLCVAGSLRRGKAEVGDVEILYVGRTEERQIDLIQLVQVDLAAERLERLLAGGVLARRRNVLGAVLAWGKKNRLAVHLATGVPVDLFAATEENWWNYLACRTGPAESNRRIAVAAIKKGWKWNPYGSGFSRGDPLAGEPQSVAVTSEAEVFEFVGLPYLEPFLRT